MIDLKDELCQVREQAEKVMAAIHVFEYAVRFLNYMSTITDESQLGVMGENIAVGMECLMDAQRQVVGRINELAESAEKTADR